MNLETPNSKFSITRSLEESKFEKHEQSGVKNRAIKMKTNKQKEKQRIGKLTVEQKKPKLGNRIVTV